MNESVPTGSRQAFSEDWTNAIWLCIKCNVLHKPVGQFILDHGAFCVLMWIHVYIFVTFLHFCGLGHCSVACLYVYVKELVSEAQFHAGVYSFVGFRTWQQV